MLMAHINKDRTNSTIDNLYDNMLKSSINLLNMKSQDYELQFRLQVEY